MISDTSNILESLMLVIMTRSMYYMIANMVLERSYNCPETPCQRGGNYVHTLVGDASTCGHRDGKHPGA